MIVAATGHRPTRLNLKYDEESRLRLLDFALDEIDWKNIKTVISGMAQGWDQAVAEAAIQRKVELIVAIPFRGQEVAWPQDAIERYKAIVSLASKTVFVSSGGYEKWKFIARDNWMIAHATSIIALWDGAQKGGTYFTVQTAMRNGLNIINLWDQWTLYNRRNGNDDRHDS